jgi:hypothetical protein
MIPNEQANAANPELSGTALPERSAAAAASVPPSETGLRSLQAIRWLLLAGALVTAVSAYRLVQLRWSLMPASAQYLLLVAGALAIFGAGLAARLRLRLPAAGSALLLLFTGLLPVLAWGAHYLHLLARPQGWIALGLGMAALLAAALGLLRGALGYRGAVYPCALAVLLAAAPLLPAAAGAWAQWALGDLFYGLAALVLGIHLFAGCREVSRAFGRRQSADAPWHLVPILLLAVLYAGAMALLDPRSPLLGLPVAIAGLSLAAAGTEAGRFRRGGEAGHPRWTAGGGTARAAGGHAPEASSRRLDAAADTAVAPRRAPASLALIAAGAALVVVALPLALRDPSLRCLALVAPCAAALFLGWSLAAVQPGVHLLGIEAAYLAWHLLPRLLPGAAAWLGVKAAALAGADPRGAAPFVCGDLAFVAALLALAVWLRRRALRPRHAEDGWGAGQAGAAWGAAGTGGAGETGSAGEGGTSAVPAGRWERLLGGHALLCALHLGGLTAMAASAGPAAYRLLAVALLLAAGGVLAARRLELVVAAVAALAGMTLTAGRALMPAPYGHALLLTSANLALLAGVLAALAAAGGRLEGPLAALTGRSVELARRSLLVPVAILALLAAAGPLALRLGDDALAGGALAMCGVALLLAGYRLAGLPLLVGGALLVSVGLHRAVALTVAGGAPWLQVLTEALLVVSWFAAWRTARMVRLAAGAGAATPGRLVFAHRAAMASLAGHCLLGIIWMESALVVPDLRAWSFPVEPLVLPLAACALLTTGVPSRLRMAVGLGGLAAWPGCELLAGRWASPWTSAWLNAMVLAAAALALLIAARIPLARLLGRWTESWPAAVPAAPRAPLATLDETAAVRTALCELVHAWCGLAVCSCLLFAGQPALLLAVAAIDLAWFAGVALAGRGLGEAFPLRLLLPALLQAAVLATAGRGGSAVLHAVGAPQLLPELVAARGFALLPPLAAGALGWRVLVAFAWRRSLVASPAPHPSPAREGSLTPMEGQLEGRVSLGLLAGLLEIGTAAGLLGAFLARPTLRPWEHVLLAAVAVGWAALHLADAVALGRRCAGGMAGAGGAFGASGAAVAGGGSGLAFAVDAEQQHDGWLMQAWIGLAVLHGYAAGWLHFGSAAGPYVLLALGACLYVVGALCSRSVATRTLSGPCRRSGMLMPAAGGLLALARVWGDAVPVWEPALAAFLISAWYFILAAHERRRIALALISAGYLGGALLGVLTRADLGREFYFLAPGLALLALAWLLRAELGAGWTRHLAAAGASCVYGTPVVALSDQVSWIWLAVLLALTIAFGGVAFAVRSRSLLLVSTAAMFTDLSFFVFKIGTTAPTLLWVFGIAAGVGLMLVAAFLESRRQGVWRELHRWRRELGAWS